MYEEMSAREVFAGIYMGKCLTDWYLLAYVWENVY